MKTGTVMKGLSLIILLAFVALFVPQVMAQDSEFIPGNDRIIEKDILRRIQEELGTDIARDKPKAEEVEARKAEKERVHDSTIRTITLSLKDQRKISGTVVLSQASVFITPENVSQEVIIPLEEIQTLEFTEWKARRLRVNEAPAQTGEKSPGADVPAENQEEAEKTEGEAPTATGEDSGSSPETAQPAKKAVSVRIYFLPTKCRVTKSDETVLSGRCQAMDWLQFNLSGKSAGGFRTYFAEERPLPQGGPQELEKSLDSLEAETPVNTVISVELGGFIQKPNSGTAIRAN